MLDILRVQIAPTNDDEILAPSRNVQLAIVDEAQVVRAQKGPLPPRQSRAEGRCRLVLTIPIAVGDARSAHPDLADPSLRRRRTIFRIADANVLVVRPPGRNVDPSFRSG